MDIGTIDYHKCLINITCLLGYNTSKVKIQRVCNCKIAYYLLHSFSKILKQNLNCCQLRRVLRRTHFLLGGFWTDKLFPISDARHLSKYATWNHFIICCHQSHMPRKTKNLRRVCAKCRKHHAQFPLLLFFLFFLKFKLKIKTYALILVYYSCYCFSV